MKCFKFVANSISTFQEPTSDYFDDIDIIKDKLTTALELLKIRNNKLVEQDAMYLVDLTREWYSWRSTYKLARSINKTSMKISSGIIKQEMKFYTLLN